jgi:hypothetical protein
VYDHHNIIYVYGPLAAFANILKRCGFVDGDFSIPAPHAHAFHGELDGDVEKILTCWEWKHFELQPDDEK